MNLEVRTIAQEALEEIYQKLLDHFGHRDWWPGGSPWEIIVGAILTQNVSWKNVEQAIANLEEAGLLKIEAIYNGAFEDIAQAIRPSRYFNMKAKKLKAIAAHIMDRYQGDLLAFLDQPLDRLREELLNIWGIGPETADSIILYAGDQPSFVVDSYTRRIFSRLGIFNEDIKYHEMRDFFMDNLPKNTTLYNDYHAQIVTLGHNICKNKPLCQLCPLLALDKCKITGGKDT